VRVWQVRSWPPQQLNDAVRRTEQNCLEPVYPPSCDAPGRAPGRHFSHPTGRAAGSAWRQVILFSARPAQLLGFISPTEMTKSPANRSRIGPKKPAADEPLHTLPLRAFLLARSFERLVVRSA
jgi:hypothetical protein